MMKSKTLAISQEHLSFGYYLLNIARNAVKAIISMNVRKNEDVCDLKVRK
jgi:hypothetical protein